MKEPVWQFCESSKPILQRCIDAAFKSNKNSNKWLKHFTSLKKEPEVINDNIDKMAVDEEIPIPIQNSSVNQEIRQENKGKSTEESSEFISRAELNDLDPVNGFEEIMGKCLENTKTFKFMAKNLPFSSIEKLCNHIFNIENLNLTFIDYFYNIFVPELLKRDNTRLSLDFLVKAKKYKENFNKLLFIIVNDIEIPKHVLTEYITTLSGEEKLDLLKYMSQNVNKDVFLYHLNAIHSLYKDCEITEDIQRFILCNFKQIHQLCLNDKVFGKFLLNFVHIQKKHTINCVELTKIVESHSSVFKKPCMNALNDIKKVQS